MFGGAISVKGKIGMHMFTENLDRHLYLNENLYGNANAMYGSFSKIMTRNIPPAMFRVTWKLTFQFGSFLGLPIALTLILLRMFGLF
jgi:hypothetical protein